MKECHGLSNELLHVILDHLASDTLQPVALDERAYLSQESFRAPAPPARSQVEELCSFRLACRRFSELGAARIFARVTTRFSIEEFKRLESLADREHLARWVRKFSYMVPCFYTEDQQDFEALRDRFEQSKGTFRPEAYTQKLSNQRQIVQTNEDVRVLKKAVSAFTYLQHVQILRVQDWEDERLLTFLRRHEDMTQFVDLRWDPAYLHSTKAIGAALLAAHHKSFSRFSSPMTSAQSAMILAQRQPRSLATLAEHLTCLELHFDNPCELDTRMQALSGLFQTVCTFAVNMEAVHVGFPSHRPLSLPLETIFHNVRWPKLIAFGVQGWRLDAEEITELARRHRERLKGLRLRDVLLKDGSRWKDVLGFLRSEMLHLEWVSLRRIGYSKGFDEYWAHAGVEIPDDPPGGADDSDDNSVDDLYEAELEQPSEQQGPDSDGEDDDGDDSAHEDADVDTAVGSWSSTFASDYASEHSGDDDDDDANDEHGPAAHELAFPDRLHSPPRLSTPNSLSWCNCDSGAKYPESVDDLDDDGIFVENQKRKAWEKWVLRRCPEHDLT